MSEIDKFRNGSETHRWFVTNFTMETIELTIRALRSENAQLRSAHDVLETENKELRETGLNMMGLNIALRAENAELRERVEAVKRDSLSDDLLTRSYFAE